MAIKVVDRSASLRVNRQPQINPPRVQGTDMKFTCSDFDVAGECQITGATGDIATGWTLGLIQLQWIETNWGWYRGQSEQDGSLFQQFARPPARPAQGCRDTLSAGSVFVDNDPRRNTASPTTGQAFPTKLTVGFTDSPADEYPLTKPNSLTGKTNFLYEVQVELHFCTVLSLRTPTGYVHLKHVLWNVHWEAEFQPTNAANPSAPWNIRLTGGSLGNTSNASRIAIDGGPTDSRFTSIITSPGALNCNSLANNNSGNLRESGGWENFDVRR